MGQNCAKPKSKGKISKNISIMIANVPSSLFNEKMRFKISLCNIRGKNLNKDEIQLYFKFVEYRIFTIVSQKKNDTTYFKFNEEFEYESTNEEMKNSFAWLILRDKNKKDLFTIKIKLYDLARGPIHNNYLIDQKSNEFSGRFVFDLKMVQKVKLSINSLSLHAKLHDPLKEKAYSYSLKITTTEGEIHSNYSYNYYNPFYLGNSEILNEDENIYEENFNYEMNENVNVKRPSDPLLINRINELKLERNLSRKLKSPIATASGGGVGGGGETNKPRNSVVRNEKMKKDMIWNHEEKKKNVPFLEVDLYTKDFSTNYLQICIWSTNNPEDYVNHPDEREKGSPDEIEDAKKINIQFIDLKLIGETCLGFNKLFRDDFHAYETNENAEYCINDMQKTYSDKIVNHGNLMGELQAFLKITLTPFIRQMFIGIRTQAGIQESELAMQKNIFLNNKCNSSQEIKKLEYLTEVLSKYVIKLLYPYERNKQREKEKLQSDAIGTLNEIISTLGKSHKENSFIYFYKNLDELIDGQTTLISLANHLLDYSDELDENLKNKYYKTLKLVVNRGELNLAYTGFEKESYSYLLKNVAKMNLSKSDLKTLNKKLKIGLNYQNFLYQALDKVLSKLNQKSVDSDEKYFVENFCALSYFRIPEFRNRFLECLTENEEEGRGKEMEMEEGGKDTQSDKYFSSFFDWEKNFYVYVKSNPKGIQYHEELMKSLENPQWKPRIARRGIVFYSILAEWCRSIFKTTINKDHVPWNELPGYKILVNIFLTELKNKSILNYPESMKDASIALLLNEKLLNNFVLIVYKNTKVFDNLAVFHTFELIGLWLESLVKEKKSCPPNFDYSFFFKGIKLVLDQDHALCICQCLTMIYNNFTIFIPEFRKELCNYLFSSIFFKLFMHWSPAVRVIFHHLLVYRIHHLHHNLKTNLTNIGDLYRELMKPQSSFQNKKHLINDVIFIQYSEVMKIIDHAKRGLEEEGSERVEDETYIESLKRKLKKDYKNQQKKKKKIKTVFLTPIQIKKEEKDVPILDLESENDNHDMNIKFGEKKQPIENKYRRNSTYITSLKENNEDTFIHFEPQSMSDLQARLEDDMKKTLICQSYRDDSFSNNFFSKNGTIFITRKNIYFNKEDSKFSHIPKENIKYLSTACKEFEKVRKKYWEWLMREKGKLSRLPEKELKLALAEINVPEVPIKILMDAMEISEEAEEW